LAFKPLNLNPRNLHCTHKQQRTLGQLARSHMALVAVCRSCKHRRVLYMPRLMERFGAEYPATCVVGCAAPTVAPALLISTSPRADRNYSSRWSVVAAIQFGGRFAPLNLQRNLPRSDDGLLARPLIRFPRFTRGAMSQPTGSERTQRISQSVAIFCNVWEDIADRADEANRERICHAIADAILAKVRAGARDPADIYAFALGKAFSAMNGRWPPKKLGKPAQTFIRRLVS
jgi:hypothetical protein